MACSHGERSGSWRVHVSAACAVEEFVGASDTSFAVVRSIPCFFKRGGARNKLRVGDFLTFSGSPGVWGPCATSSAQLAVSEINKRGGILGREIELSIYDAGGPIDEVALRAEQAIAFDEVDVIVGSHTSAVRVALREVTRNRIPYIYTPVYEGGERTPGVIAIGETPRSQSRPSIDWLADAKKASRWYLIGSDYVWPWQSHRAVKKYIADTGGHVVGEEFVPVGEDNHEAASRAHSRREARCRADFADRHRQHHVQPGFRRMRPRRNHAAAGRRDGRDRSARHRRRQYGEPVLRLGIFQLRRLARQ